MKDPKQFYLNDTRFESDGEYLASLFTLIDLMIFRDPGARMAERGLMPDQDPEEWMQLLPDRAEMTEQTGGRIVLEDVLERTGAPWQMRIVLGFLLRCALEPSYEAEAAAERGKRVMTLFDLFSVMAAPYEKDDPAAVYGMLEESRKSLDILFPQLLRREQASGQSIAGLLPVMDGRLVSILLGENRKKELSSGMEIYIPGAADKGIEAAVKQGAEKLLRRAEKMPPEAVVLWGREGSGKRPVMKAFAELSKRELIFCELPGYGEESDDRDERSREDRYPSEIYRERLYPELLRVRRECVLFGCVPVITGAERLPKSGQLEIRAFLRKHFFGETGSVYILMEAEEAPDHLSGCFFLPMEEIRSEDRIRLWEESLPGDADISREGIEAIANTFALTPGQIRDAAGQAVLLAGPDEKVGEELLYKVCYAKLGHPLKKHSQRVRSPFVWDDLKMAAPDKAVLKDLCECVRNRHIVMQKWNFEKKVPYGSGITALFAGPPGTGKTMAAQVIANELKMELYKIDLSQLIDKYVGETEKNIKRVFDLAKRSNSVLFFDEADAIFNKRLTAESSNDRFANIESSLLLQCIEEFSGVTLLATNNMGNIDVAFMRRFRFYLLFKEPDEDIRYEIWRSVFPPEAPVKPEVDFMELARLFSFTGAVIKNVAMQAAYLAAERGGEIGILEIMVAVRREMQKEQRMLSRDSMGKYEKLFPEVIGWNSGL